MCIRDRLSCVCSTTAGKFKVNLSGCNIGAQGYKYLVSGLHRCLDTHSTVTTTLCIVLFDSDINDQGVSEFSKLLQTDCIKTLNLAYNFELSDEGVCIIAEKLKHNTSLRTLRLVGCCLESKGVECLASALTTNSSLVELYCGNTRGDDVIEQLAHAIRVNNSLKVLYLGNCGMRDEGLESLARSLQHNKSLKQLNICNTFWSYYREGLGYWSIANPNTITKKGVSVLTKCLKKNNSLSKLILPAEFKSSTTIVQEAVNEARKKNGQPFIEVIGESFSLQLVKLGSVCTCATYG